MAKIIISDSDSEAARPAREIELGRAKLSIGRHPRNDVVIEQGAVSARHALIVCEPDGVFLEDLDSTNGTFVNGKRVGRHRLADGDRVLVAATRIDFVAGPPEVQAGPGAVARIDITNGHSAGKSVPLTKPMTTLGSPGVVVVVISRRDEGYFLSHLDGATAPLLNGSALGGQARALAAGDQIELAGTVLNFVIG